MVRLCNTCRHFRREYDEFRQSYVDTVKINDNAPEPHFCPMYDANIPNEIYYQGAGCEWYGER